MSDRIDIHDPIYEIANRLGLEPNDVGEIVFRPRSVTATVYLKNKEGNNYVNAETNEPATETLEFQVET